MAWPKLDRAGRQVDLGSWRAGQVDLGELVGVCSVQSSESNKTIHQPRPYTGPADVYTADDGGGVRGTAGRTTRPAAPPRPGGSNWCPALLKSDDRYTHPSDSKQRHAKGSNAFMQVK